MSDNTYPVKKNGEYEVTVQKLAFGGAGVARMNNYVIFIKGVLPEEKVKIRIVKRKSTYAEAKLLEIVESSRARIRPPCRYHGWCGGCTWQFLSYEDQLKYKKEVVKESIEHIAGLENFNILPVLSSDKAFGYRNKMEFSFSDKRWLLPEHLSDQTILKDFSLGLHAPGTFDRVINIDECLLQSERANLILRTVADYCIGNKLQPYGIKSHQGFLRFLVIRQSQYNNGIMVNIVTAFENPDLLKGLTALLVKQFPEIKSIMNNINPKPAQIAMGEKEILLYGTPAIAEKLSNLSFSISANSFFQTNTKQAELMYKEVLEFADLKKHEVVWDLYSGTGTFALFLAKNAKFVTGFELIKSAVENAWQNAKENQIHNVRFVEGDILFQIQHFDEKPDVIITDPPRSGMHEKIVKVILGIAPARIIYVSCNPATLARDLSVLIEKYYIEKIQPIDMFPQTYHIETIVKLVRKE